MSIAGRHNFQIHAIDSKSGTLVGSIAATVSVFGKLHAVRKRACLLRTDIGILYEKIRSFVLLLTAIDFVGSNPL